MTFSNISRRQLIRTAALGVGAGLIKTATNAFQLEKASTISDRAHQPGRVPSKIGQRSPFEKPERHIYKALPSGWSMTPLESNVGIITPSDLHFERHHGGIPTIDPDKYELLIHGMVRKPLKFTLSDIKRFPAQSRTCFIECSGNGIDGYYAEKMRENITPGELDGMVSTSEWTGVMLSTLLRECGVKPKASWLLAEGQDAAALTRSVPKQFWDQAMIVYGQNGEALRPAQGYPVRLLLPGVEGNAQVKWLRRIELSDQPFMTREETAKYTDVLPNGKARMFSLTMDARSIITFPAYPDVLYEKGWWEIRGLAWTGRGKISRVEVSTDGGKNWQRAVLQDPVLPNCTTRFRFLWNWRGKKSYILSRAIDETGYVQPTWKQLIDVRGERSYYHTNNIRAWKVMPTGEVFFGLHDLI